MGFISASGRYVTFQSGASSFVPGVVGSQIWVRDLLLGATELQSVASDGSLGNGPSESPSITTDGRYVAFRSAATNLVLGDSNALTDVFIHDRYAAGFTSICDPGIDSVIACPCGNAPSGAGRGCDNSAATGGASLAASGIAYLSIDSLVFTATDERPNSTSVLVEGTAPVSSGLVFGQGVRCLGGTLKRLYVKTAVSGSITAPDFGAGDPTVSARSAALGDPILPGETRWYLVYYRDPLVLGGCPATSTFNSTQTGRVDWLP